MHIKDKQAAIRKIAGLLNPEGRLVLSIDKSQSNYIDTGTRKVPIFPDNPKNICECIQTAGLSVEEEIETEFAHIFVAVKG